MADMEKVIYTVYKMERREKNIMVKVFTPNAAGKIEFTKDELEKLLNEVWSDGRSHNMYCGPSPNTTIYTTTNPENIPTTPTTKTVPANGDNICW